MSKFSPVKFKANIDSPNRTRKPISNINKSINTFNGNNKKNESRIDPNANNSEKRSNKMNLSNDNVRKSVFKNEQSQKYAIDSLYTNQYDNDIDYSSNQYYNNSTRNNNNNTNVSSTNSNKDSIVTTSTSTSLTNNNPINGLTQLQYNFKTEHELVTLRQQVRVLQEENAYIYQRLKELEINLNKQNIVTMKTAAKMNDLNFQSLEKRILDDNYKYDPSNRFLPRYDHLEMSSYSNI
jgi:hypothetical protein